uniref:2Fe-2S ferredoxin-type domain-containing protein n=1 Tax=Panagrellus redivivus TaxID=6233 RepID=A0A7E4VP50_PANRE
MGGCSSCLRVILEAESDVKINVIEPTTIVNEPSMVLPSNNTRTSPVTPSGPHLTVPAPHGVRKAKDID